MTTNADAPLEKEDNQWAEPPLFRRQQLIREPLRRRAETDVMRLLWGFVGYVRIFGAVPEDFDEYVAAIVGPFCRSALDAPLPAEESPLQYLRVEEVVDMLSETLTWRQVRGLLRDRVSDILRDDPLESAGLPDSMFDDIESTVSLDIAALLEVEARRRG